MEGNNTSNLYWNTRKENHKSGIKESENIYMGYINFAIYFDCPQEKPIC